MDQERVWDEILLLIENRMSKQGYDTWFSQSKLLSIDGNRLTIEVPSKFHRDWIKEHHWSTLFDVIKEVTKRNDIEIEFFVQPQQQKKATKQVKEDKKEGRDEIKGGGLFEKKYTFSNYIRPFHHQYPHHSSSNRNRNIFTDAKNLHTTRNSGKFGGSIANIGN